MSDQTPDDGGIWKHLRRSWRSLFAIQALCIILGILVLGPIFTLIVEGTLARSSKTVLSDTDIVGFIASPSGLLTAFAIGAIWLTLQLLGYAAQLVAGHQSYHGQSVRLIPALTHLASRLPSLLSLSFRFLLQITLIALPFLTIVGLVVWVQLGQKDINYYLTSKPPEFILAVVLTAISVAIMGFFVIRHATGWIHALPLVLFAGRSAAAARRESLDSSRGQKKRVALALALWGFGTPLLILPLNLLWPPLILWTAETFQHRLGLLALTLAVLFALSGGLAFFIGFLTQSLLALYNLKLFRQAGLDPETPVDCETKTARAVPWRLLITASCLGLLVSGWFCHQRLDRLTMKDDAVVIAHRGASAKAPENTMAAIELAVDSGAEWVEIDVQETVSGEVLVFHDKDYMRMSKSPTKLRDVTPEERAELDIGSWFEPRFSDQRTPTLNQVLDFCRDRSGIIIELKYYGDEENLEQRVIDLVEAANMEKQVKLMSLKLKGVEKIRALRPSWNVGLLSSVAVGDLTRLDVDFLGLNAGSINDRLVDRAHKADMEVYAWTVNDPTNMSAMLSRGVDGLITDRPARCRKVIEERSTLNPGERLLIDLAARLGQLPTPDQP